MPVTDVQVHLNRLYDRVKVVKCTDAVYKRWMALITGLVILADQGTKYLVQAQMHLHQSIPVIDGFFSITYILNPGGAFGFFSAQPALVRKLVFIFLTAAIAGFILYLFFRTVSENRFLAFGFALIFSGAAGNLVDRIRTGEVIDFLDVYIGAWHWPAFNVADSAISTGMIILFYHIVFNRLPDY